MPRPRWRLRTTLVGIAALAVLLSGHVQVERWHREEQAAQHALMRSLPERRVRRFFGPEGVSILQAPTKVEVIRALDPGRDDVAVRPTGRFLDGATSGAVTRVLLDGTGYFICDDFPEPVGGLRFWRGDEAVDVLFGEPSGKHVDVWNVLRDGHGQVVRKDGWYCLENGAFARLIGNMLE